MAAWCLETSIGSTDEFQQVTWDSPEDTENPKNWSMSRKWAATIVLSSFTFISPTSSSMVAPALGKVGADLGIKTEAEMQLTLSIFVLAYAIGPLFLGPISEEYGRVPVLQLSNLFFLAWNTGCGFAQSKGQLIAFRFLSGLGGSAPLAIGGGILSDCWRAEERGKSIAIYSLAPMLGPAVGKSPSTPRSDTTRYLMNLKAPLLGLGSQRRRHGVGCFGLLAS